MTLLSKGLFLPHGTNESIFQVTNDSIEIPFTGNVTTLVLKQGKYKFEAYGASGGGQSGLYTTARNISGEGCLSQEIVTKYQGNTQCTKKSSTPGSGGYVSGLIVFPFPVVVYVYVGGKGLFDSQSSPGGFNGGGSSNLKWPNLGQNVGSGGGETDFRVISDTLYHRMLVAGGGGGADNAYGACVGTDDGSGGSGGLPSQGLWINGKYQQEYEVNTIQGFTFGQGQNGHRFDADESPGAGGGFFGGLVTDASYNAGAGGGSSFAFSRSVEYPKGKITATDENGVFLSSRKYAFSEKTPFAFSDVEFATGIRGGDGLARITVLEVYDDPLQTTKLTCKHYKTLLNYSFFLTITILMRST